MPETHGTGLLMAWMDIDPAHEDVFNHWYNKEHIGRLLAIPGFLSAARYVALRGQRCASVPGARARARASSTGSARAVFG